MNANFFRRHFLQIIGIILPTVIGAILGQYLNLSWILLISALISLFVFTVYWYFHQNFKVVIEQIGTIRNKLARFEGPLGMSDGAEKLSWLDFWIKLQNLASMIQGSNFDPDIVISIGRSGAVVGGIVASLLGSKKHVSFDRMVILRKCPDFTQRSVRIEDSILPNFERLAGKKILCVMSECTTGETLEVANRFFRDIPNVEVKTAVLFSKPNVKFRPFFIADLAEQWPALPFRNDMWKNYYPSVEEKVDEMVITDNCQ